MDDIVMFHDDPGHLAAARDQATAWLAAERGLRFGKGGTIAPTTEPFRFLGYTVSRRGLTPSRKLRRNLRVRLARAAARGPTAFRRSLAAYRGLLA
jgi:hypothetical protein